MGQILGLPLGKAVGTFGDGGGIAAQKHRVLGKIGQSGGHFGVNLGQIAVGGRQIPQLLQSVGVGKQGLFQLAVDGLAACQLAQGGAQTVDAPLCQRGQGFPHGKDGDGGHRLGTTLGHRVEAAQRVHIIAPEFGAHRLGVTGGEDVQNTAAEGELAGTFHLCTAGVARQQQPLHQPLHRIAAVGQQGHGGVFQPVGGQGAQHQGIGRGAQHPGLTGFDAPQGGKALLLVLVGHALHVVEHKVAAGQQGGSLTGESLQVGGEGAGRSLVPQHHTKGAVGQIGQQSRGQLGPMDGGCAVDRGGAAVTDGLQQTGIFRKTAQQCGKQFHGGYPPLSQANGMTIPLPRLCRGTSLGEREASGDGCNGYCPVPVWNGVCPQYSMIYGKNYA